MVNGKTRVFVLLGSPVGHSLSPSMQNAAFHALGLNAVYVPLHCGNDDVSTLLRAVARAGGGGNVTVPHKEAAAGAVSVSSRRVQETRACNTFWSQNNQVAGDNTDVVGVLTALDQIEAPSTCWLVLGTGGSARAVCAAARERSAAVAVRSRSNQRRQEFESWAAECGVRLCRPEEAQVIINATPLGLQPTDPLPIDPGEVPAAVAALDLVYTRQGTRWSRVMRGKGVRSADGREALIAQGAAAFEKWYPDERAPTEIMRAVVDATLR